MYIVRLQRLGLRTVSRARVAAVAWAKEALAMRRCSRVAWTNIMLQITRQRFCFATGSEGAELCSALSNVVCRADVAGKCGVAQSDVHTLSVSRAPHNDTRAAHSDCMVDDLMSGVGPSRPRNEDQVCLLTGTVQKVDRRASAVTSQTPKVNAVLGKIGTDEILSSRP